MTLNNEHVEVICPSCKKKMEINLLREADVFIRKKCSCGAELKIVTKYESKMGCNFIKCIWRKIKHRGVSNATQEEG